MNYFELFGLPVSLSPDKSNIPLKYFELQKKYHPDFYSKSDDEEQNEMLEKSSAINKGFKILQDKDSTIQYVLELKGLLAKDEKYELSPEFLMQMMEINEDLEVPQDSSIDETEVKIHQIENSLYEEVRNIIEYYNESNTTEAQLLLVKDYYFKKKYLKRILERLEGMRNIASQ